MKYYLFSLTILGIVPAIFFILMDRRLLRLAMTSMLLPILAFNQTAINFFSHETYRGTSRGLEISLIYFVSLIIVLSITLLKGFRLPMLEFGGWLFVLYFACSCISAKNSAEKIYSSFELWKMLMMLLVFYATYCYLWYTHGDFDCIMFSFALLLLINFPFILKQHYLGNGDVRGFFPHRNSLAMFASLMGILLFSRFFNKLDDGQYRKLFYGILFIIASGTLARTYSRGAIGCYPIGFAMALGLSLIFKLSFRKLYIMIPLAVVCILGAIAFLPRVIERFETAPEKSADTRKELAIIAVNMIKEAPWFGVGINNWGVNIRRHSKEYTGIVETIYLLVAAECGLIGLAGLLLWFAYYWLLALILCIKLRNHPNFYIPVGVIGGLTNIYLQSVLEWVLKQQINFVQLMVIYACLSYLRKSTKWGIGASTTQPSSSQSAISPNPQPNIEEAPQPENSTVAVIH